MNPLRRFAFAIIGCVSMVLTGCQSQKSFATPDEAVAALETAVSQRDKEDLHDLFGSRISELKTGDQQVDDEDFLIFSRRLEAAHKLQMDSPEQATLLVGEEQWPFAVPLVKGDKGWHFDTEAGIEEMTNRFIGRNERLTIAACQTLIDGQAEYFERDPNGSGVKHYAQKLMSSPGQKDGLYWPVTGNEDPPPIGPVFAEAAHRKDEKGQPVPFNGYKFKLLTSQGAGAPGGAMDYLQDGKLTKGWAAVAWPAEYDRTGVMSFMFGSDGMIYQKDLGDDGDLEIAAINAYDPSGWAQVN
jgi:hypothetical protein